MHSNDLDAEHPLAHMVFAMLKKYNLIEKMNLDNGVLQYYVSTIERGYRYGVF